MSFRKNSEIFKTKYPQKNAVLGLVYTVLHYFCRVQAPPLLNCMKRAVLEECFSVTIEQLYGYSDPVPTAGDCGKNKFVMRFVCFVYIKSYKVSRQLKMQSIKTSVRYRRWCPEFLQEKWWCPRTRIVSDGQRANASCYKFNSLKRVERDLFPHKFCKYLFAAIC